MQHVFDFDTAIPEQKSSAPTTTVNPKTLAWLAIGEIEPCGDWSDETCAHCTGPILVDDEFGMKFSVHTDCFELEGQ